ncbi:hypothetical protein [Vibrio sp. B1FLJ16]|uniref:hypothetical protein n=1 Tax=Vibrio sp. B1FLJ16 TaxID=2751178 RepID=UPI001FD6249D|nr:hypothetical protein [Vibrio sp. B1FLJ16]
MADSRRASLDPRSLILDPAMQARDVELIKDKRVRSAQEIKQESQSKEILEDLRNGLPIRHPITVFVVDDKYYVVDGFHRTDACLKYLEENPNADLMINSLIIENRTYAEAFSAAQDVNQAHGVGVTKDEIMQAQFRKLIVNREFDLSVSQVSELVGCSRGQAAHIANGLKACKQALGSAADIEMDDLESFVERLQVGLNCHHYLPESCWDSKGFPKIRRLSDAVKGKDYIPDMDDEDWERKQIEDASKSISRLVKFFGEDIFREGLRKVTRGSQLGISISQRSKWLEQAGTIGGSIQDENSGNKAPYITGTHDF